MNKKLFLIFFAFLLVLAAVKAEERGCCYNPNAALYACVITDPPVWVLDSECCSPSTYRTSNNPEGPYDFNDCIINYFRPNMNCSDVPECTNTGCCCPSTDAGIPQFECDGDDETFHLNPMESCAVLCAAKQCNDGTDNDGDGCCDAGGCAGMPADPGCADINDDNEADGPPCPIVGQCLASRQPVLTELRRDSAADKGKKQITLKWNDDAACTANFFKVYRCEDVGCDDFGSEPIATTPVPSYRDTTVEWDKIYRYAIVGVYTVNSDANLESIYEGIFAGNLECWYKYDDRNFCINEPFYEQFSDYIDEYDVDVDQKVTDMGERAYKCDEENLLDPVHNCKQEPGTVCIVKDNEVDCVKHKGGCKMFPEALPFGMFYERGICEGTASSITDGPYYCFYDKSDLLMDRCYKCEPEMSCYDYKSQSACGSNNCGAGNCEWHPSITYGFLGIGVCVNLDEDNCKWCDKKGTEGMENLDSFNEVFDLCTPEKAQILGTGMYGCYYSSDGTARSCYNTICTDYLSETDCVADPCDVGNCDWFGGSQCYKNAFKPPYDEPDDPNDCGLIGDLTNPHDEGCERDHYPPNTTIVAEINKRGIFRKLNIIIEDKVDADNPPTIITDEEGYRTYLCVGQDCNVMSSYTNSSVLAIIDLIMYEQDGEQTWQLTDGLNTIKFLSMDPAKNLEEEKSIDDVVAYNNSAGPMVKGVLITTQEESVYAIEEGGIYYTNDVRPDILIRFYTGTEIVNNVVGLFKVDGALVPKPIDVGPPGKDITISMPDTAGDLSQGNYMIKLYAEKTKNLVNGILMDEDENITFVVDTTHPSLISSTVNEGDVITTSDVDFGFVFDEPVKLEEVVLDGEDILSNFSSDFRDSFSETINLSDNEYTLHLKFRDYAGNSETEDISFTVDGVPTVIELLEPTYGVSPVYTFDVVIKTDNAVKCRYSFGLPMDYGQSLPFDVTGRATLHTKSNFQFPYGLTEPRNLYVKCDDEGFWGVIGVTFSLSVDQIPPNIMQAYAHPSVVAEAPFWTDFKVETNEETICKYSATETNYDNMEGKFRGHDGGIFKLINTQNVTLASEGSYSYYVACEDKAGLKSTAAQIDFIVDLDAPLIVESLTPYYNAGEMDLIVETNKNSQCFYNPIDREVGVGPGTASFGPPGRLHSNALLLLAGNYTYYVKCSNPIYEGDQLVRTEWSDPIAINFIVDVTPPQMIYVDDTNVLIPISPEVVCYKWLVARWLAVEDRSTVGKYAYSIHESGSQGEVILDWTHSFKDGGTIVGTRNENNALNLLDGTEYYFKVKAANVMGVWSDPMDSDGFTANHSLCEIECNNTKDDCCYAHLDDVCDPDCMSGFDIDCDYLGIICTPAESTPDEPDCCNVESDGTCDKDCVPFADVDCIPVCQAGFCDMTENKWCDEGFWSDQDYCSHCNTVDIDCGELCSVPGMCDSSSEPRVWCDDGLWSTDNYCTHCYIFDSTCPICEPGNCDTENQKWCEDGFWSVIDYCGNCGGYDAYCNETCEPDACDLTHQQWCDAGEWKSEDYCSQCGDQDSRCTYDCTPYSCDTSAKKWCDNGKWNTSYYCDNCGGYDLDCDAACISGTCDMTNNVWCDVDSWSRVGYCDHCDDPICTGECTSGVCDLDSNTWCSFGEWVETDYCEHCGTVDSDCSISCIDDSCDIVNDKWCDDGDWEIANYCDYCAFDDSDCIDVCPHGYCDVTSELWCSQGNWTNESYCDYCYAFDSNCPSACSNIADNCCHSAADGVCDPNCMQDVDPDCGLCTSAMNDCCEPAPDGVCDYDCPTGLDPDCGESCIIEGNCPDGHACQDDYVCASGWCDNGVCAAANCDDGIENGDESDVDCGGICDPCENGKNCGTNSDCESNFCRGGVCDEPGECENGVLSNGESDIDCGGPCPACGEGEYCNDDSDCVSGAQCIDSVCTIPASLEEIDSDGDGMPDEWELNNGLDPNDPYDAQIDNDGDGLPNIDEYLQNTDPNNPDTDGDGFTDGEEVEAGTNPLDPEDHPKSKLWIFLLIIIILVILALVGYLVYTLWGDKIKKQVAVFIRKTPLKEWIPAIKKWIPFMPKHAPPYRPIRPPYRPIRPYRPVVRQPYRPIRPLVRPPVRPAPPVKPVVRPAKPMTAIERLKAIATGKPGVKLEKKVEKVVGKPTTPFERLKAITEKPKEVKETKIEKAVEKPEKAGKAKPMTAMERLKALTGRVEKAKPAKKVRKITKPAKLRKAKVQVIKPEIKVIIKPEIKGVKVSTVRKAPGRKRKKTTGKKKKTIKKKKTVRIVGGKKITKITTIKKEVTKSSGDVFKKLSEISKKKK